MEMKREPYLATYTRIKRAHESGMPMDQACLSIELAVKLRLEHAARVWQAMQACLMVWAFGEHACQAHARGWAIGRLSERRRARRERAHRSWQAMGCLVLVASAWKIGRDGAEPDDRGRWGDFWVFP